MELFMRVYIVVTLIFLMLGCASRPNVTFAPGDQPTFVALPSSSYMMGDQTGSGDSDERPAHQVAVKKFSLSVYEITQQQYAYFTQVTQARLPAQNNSANGQHPVVNISLKEAKGYAKWLSSATGNIYRLPTEEEWEYAARSGVLSLYTNGNQETAVCQIANIADDTASQANVGWRNVTHCRDGAVYTSVVGAYRPNNFGLYDMIGNVWEWTSTCYNGKYDSKNIVRKIACEENVIRGGSFMLPAKSARLSNREAMIPTERNSQIGFRLVQVK